VTVNTKYLYNDVANILSF